MPANTTPIFPITPRVTSAAITVANFAKGGTTAFGALGTTPTFTTVYTAGANGSRIDQIKVRSLGLNGATTLRLFVNTGTTNVLVHERTLDQVGTTVTTRTVTNQTVSGNTFTTSAAHGLTVGQIVNFTVLSTLTAVNTTDWYYVSSVPSTTTFTLTKSDGTAVTVGSNVTAATATLAIYSNLEVAASTDIDVTIAKNTTETAVPIPYVASGQTITATIASINPAPYNAGWQVTVHGADY